MISGSRLVILAQTVTRFITTATAHASHAISTKLPTLLTDITVVCYHVDRVLVKGVAITAQTALRGKTTCTQKMGRVLSKMRSSNVKSTQLDMFKFPAIQPTKMATST